MVEDPTIQEITPTQEAWERFLDFVKEQGEIETNRILLDEDYFLESHILVAWNEHHPLGYLRYIHQRLGEGEDRPLVKFSDKVLVEVKVLAFYVLPGYRNRGIGRRLQLELIRRARESGCYQVRSRSRYSSEANHHLKISLGFGIQPSLEDDSVYFVMKL